MSTQGVSKKTSRRINIVVFLILSLVGLFSAYHLTYLTLAKMSDAKKWAQVTCEVISSQVLTSTSHGSHSSTTYKAQINYRYEYEGKSYTNNTYHFQEYYTSAYNHEYQLTREYPPGRKFSCFVNPQNPREAVIDPKPGFYLIICLFPLIFFFVGIVGLYATFKKPQDEQKTIDKQTGNIILKEKSTPLNSFIIILLICVFWNGMVLLMASQLLVPNERGSIALFDLLFASVFIIAGLLLIFGVCYSFLALFNPKISMELNTAHLVLDERYQLNFKLIENFTRLRDLKIDLIATEKVTTISGGKTRTEDKIVFQKNIYQTNRVIQNSSISFDTPAKSALNFLDTKNSIIWSLKATGNIAFWPDMVHEFEISIYQDKMEVESLLSL
ncbi:MAG: DUF3592 domain-containing protein [Proteobacteria bacterium]|nr:DUF3592 domain-containing protein [Pseudomonadota bacterium]